MHERLALWPERMYIMYSLILSQTNGKVTADSRDIAERFEKDHRHVLEAIDSIMGGMPKIGQTPEEFFIPSTYVHEQNGQTYRNYLMTRDGFSLLAMGFTGSRALEWKLKYIEAFNLMEAELYKVKVPQTYAEALRLAAEQAEQIEAHRKEISELTPKAKFYDAVVDCKDAIAIGDVAKILGIQGLGRNNLFLKLRSMGVLMSDNMPYQRFIDAGYFNVVEESFSRKGEPGIYKKTLVYQKGLEYIRRLVS